MLDTSRIELAQRKYDQAVGQREALRTRKSELSLETESLNLSVIRLGKLLSIFHEMSQSVHGQFLHGIEELVSEGLTAVFGRLIEFTILPVIRGKNVNLDFHLSAGGVDSDDLVASHGGGLVSVAGVILRLIVLRFLRTSNRQIAFLDEPLAHLSEEFIAPCAELLKRLSEDLQIQIILVTHQPEFEDYADRIIRLERKAGSTVAASVHANMG